MTVRRSSASGLVDLPASLLSDVAMNKLGRDGESQLGPLGTLLRKITHLARDGPLVVTRASGQLLRTPEVNVF